jgi:hypothetical protein
MEPIQVPQPSPTAFNKNRPISDLIRKQIEHFQHIQKKHKIKIDPVVGQNLDTEGGAARYITAMTRALRAQALSGAAAIPPRAPIPMPTPARATPGEGLALAAAADSPGKPTSKMKAPPAKPSNKAEKP